MPITWILVLFVCSRLLRDPARKRLFFWLAFALLYLGSNRFLVNELMHLWEGSPVAIAEINKPYTYGVILGGVTDPNQTPLDRVYLAAGADRLSHAVQLYKAGYLEQIVVSGGSGRLLGEEVTEATLMQIYLVQAGVDRNDILTDRQSRNTRENASYVEEMLQASDRVMLITSAYHMPRAKATFEHQGLQVDPFPTDFKAGNREYTPDALLLPSPGAFNDFHTLFHEMFGFLAYRIWGYI